jgi:hypothetical protein
MAINPTFIKKIQSIHNNRKPRTAAVRPATYSALPLIPTAKCSPEVPEEVREPLPKYPPSFCALKLSVQGAYETER